MAGVEVRSLRDSVSDLWLAVRIPLTLWHRAWPITALAIALAVNLAWIGLLAYGLTKLL